MPLARNDVDRWLTKYVVAWKTYDREQIESLFAEDIRYRFHPYDDPVVGRNAVVAAWLGEGDAAGASTRDERDTYHATYATIAVDGNVAIAVGVTTYLAYAGGPIDRVFDNCFVMRFDDGVRCCEFSEWFMLRPKR
jgi:hypothetical protein